MDISEIQARLRAFAAEREWDQYHTPKNLSTALVCEAAELAEIFQWMTPSESQECIKSVSIRKEISDELADVFLYCLRLSDKLGVDLGAAIDAKMKQNAEKYPIDKARGNATKYSRREEQ